MLPIEEKLLTVHEDINKKLSAIKTCDCPNCGAKAELTLITLTQIAYLCRSCEFSWTLDHTTIS